jgi:tetratricopeptide (TPR) repeat protein
VEALETTSEYSRAEVRRILRINENRLRSWERHGLCEPRAAFGFQDLVALRTLLRLSDGRIPPARVRDSMDALRSRLKNVRRPLLELSLHPAGRRVAVDLPNARMEALTGQLMLDFESAGGAQVREFRPRGLELEQPNILEAEAWFQRGLDIEETGGEAKDAGEAYQRALDLNPNAAGAWVNLGTLRYRQNDLREAERCYRGALLASPDYALAHFNLGNICEESARLDEAAAYYDRALELNPAYADAHYNLALVCERNGELMRAAKHWRAYLKIDQTSAWAGIARQQLSGLMTVTRGGAR